MGLKKQITTIIIALAATFAGLTVPASNAEATTDSPPEFNSVKCDGWQIDDFQITEKGEEVIISGFQNKANGTQKAEQLSYICFPDVNNNDSPITSIGYKAFEDNFEKKFRNKYKTVAEKSERN